MLTTVTQISNSHHTFTHIIGSFCILCPRKIDAHKFIVCCQYLLC